MRRALRSLPLLLTSRVLGLVLALCTLKLAGHTLPETELGQLLLGLAILQATSLFATLGYQSYAVTQLAGGRTFVEVAHEARRPLRMRCALAATFCATLLLAIEGTRSLSLFVLVPVHALFLLQLSAVPSLASGRGGPLARAELESRLLSLAGAGILALTGTRIPGLWALAFCAGSILPQAILALRSHERDGEAKRATPDPASHERTLGWIAIGDLLRAGYVLAPHLWVRRLALGQYAEFGAATRLASVPQLLPQVLSTLLLGPLGRLSRGSARRQTLRALPVALFAGVLVSALLAWPAEFWIRWFFPELEGTRGGAHALRWVAASLPAIFVASLILPCLLGQGRAKQVAAISLGGALVMVAALGYASVAGTIDAGAAARAAFLCEVCVASFAVVQLLRLPPTP